ncbi:substrate-binding domain-containing protein [Lactobacillus sp. R2/2]|nr:substrate-binding domain-containing protein [Lactobacillus sp. R2/2]
MSIVGFDDTPVASKLQLTTIRQNTSEIARVSSTNLLKILKREDILEHKFTIPVSLVKRKTT